MITNGKINILEDIIVDYNLPKHQKNNEITINDGISLSSFINTTPSSYDSTLDHLDYLNEIRPSLYLKFKRWIYKKLYLRNKEIGNKKILTPEDLKLFFSSVKENVCEIDQINIDEVLAKYELTLKNAEYNNQIALVERIKDFAEILKYELLLSTTKFNKFIKEESIVKFYNKVSVHQKYKTNLCLTYIKNFVKIIPEEITSLKKEADELKIFDNYLILHYDYSGKAVNETKAEKEKRKDPILFGVIKNSTNLYYIGDWVDDYCDLTLDVIIKKIGEKSVEEIDSISLMNKIDKI